MSLDSLLQTAIGASLAELHTAEPGKVISYQAGTPPIASVQPVTRGMILLSDETYEEESRAIIPNVPVMFPCGGGYSITWPLAAGDDVLIIYAERSIAGWKKSGAGDQSPGDPRRHNESDAIAIPIGRPGATPGFVITGDDIRLGDSAAMHPLAYGDVVKDIVERVLNVIATMAPIGNLGAPVAFSTDVAGQDGKGTIGGYTAVKAAITALVANMLSAVSRTK